MGCRERIWGRVISKGLWAVAIVGMCLGGSARAATIADWNFETNNFATTHISTTSGTLAADGGGLGWAWGVHSLSCTYSSPAGNGSPHSFSSNNWTQGDFYEFQISTTNYQGVGISWDQTSSNTGPGLYQLQYSTDGTDFTNIGNPYTVLANASPNPLWNATTYSSSYTFTPSLSAITALSNQPTLYFRLEDATSTVAAGAGYSLGSGGTDRIDNVMITGTLTSQATWPPSSTSSSNWDGTTPSWSLGGGSTTGNVANSYVTFDNSGLANGSLVNISGAQATEVITVSNSSGTYTFSGGTVTGGPLYKTRQRR